MPLPVRSRFACLALVALGLLLPAAVAEAACVAYPGPDGAVPAGTGGNACIAGTVTDQSPHRVAWTVEREGLWQIELEALPGQVGLVALSGLVDGSERRLWDGRLTPDAGSAVSPPLLLRPGGYALAIASASGAMVYRLRVGPADALPGPTATPATDAFATLARGTGSEIRIPWEVGATPDGTLWTVEIQPPPGHSVTATLRDAGGNTVVYTYWADAAGTLRLADLRLAAGAYTLLLSGATPDMPLRVAAATQQRPLNFAAEPDDLAERAHDLVPGIAAEGRLASAGTYPESDLFALVVPDGTPVARYDISLATAPAASLTLGLAASTGGSLMDRTAEGVVELRDVALGPGRTIVRVTGSLPPQQTYRLLAEPSGRAIDGAEAEPNDQPPQATPLTPGTAMTGVLTDGDRDYVDLGVAGDLQLWDVTVIGDGVDRLTLYDAARQTVATTLRRGDSPMLRLTRLLLPPGRNIIGLEGSGDWLLRATPLGPPVAGEEAEPNGDASRAIILPADTALTGWLDPADDLDFYAFHLAAEHRVRLVVDAPVDFPVQLDLSWGEWSSAVARAVSNGAAGERQSLVWDGLLPTGDYLVVLSSPGVASRAPYRLTLELPSAFDRPADLEPNDNPWQAVPLPADRVLAGTVAGSDVDWYVLPVDLPGPLTITADTLPGWITIRLGRDTGGTSPEVLQDAYLYASGESATFALPAGDGRLVLGISGAPGAYALALGAASVTPPASSVTATLAFDAATIAAFLPEAQRLTGSLTVTNGSPSPVEVTTASWLGDERWRLDGVPDVIGLGSGEAATFPLALEIAPDSWDGLPTGIELALTEANGAVTTARSIILADAAGAPVAPHRFEPLPAALLGGLDLAAARLGGASPDAPGLIDGVVDVYGIALPPGTAVTFDLAGPAAPVAGIILRPPQAGAPGERLADFTVEASTDGIVFTTVLAARLSPDPREQAFVFAAPVTASHLRLVARSSHGGPRQPTPRLAEFKAIAAPGYRPVAEGYDLADPLLGGHVVAAAGFGPTLLTGETAPWPGSYAVATAADRSGPVQWVIGFAGGRTAALTSIHWHERADTPTTERMQGIEVSLSTVGPLGPWNSAGRLDPAAGRDGLVFAAPVWARAVAFTVVTPATGRVTLPDRIEIREAAGPSILGEWGELSPAGPFERSGAASPTPPLPDGRAGGPADAPVPLAVGERAAGLVQRGVAETWYAVTVPPDAAGLRADFAGIAPAVALDLFAADGAVTPFRTDPVDPAALLAAAAPGSYRLRVTQPRASIVVSWDTSGSVGSIHPAIARLMRQLAWQLEPGASEVNLLPFRNGAAAFLMPDFSGRAADVYAAVHAYPLDDLSSDAEGALLAAATTLAGRPGARAVLLITDASYSGVSLTEELWQVLATGQIDVFAGYVPVDTAPLRALRQAALLTDWAGAGDGLVTRFGSQGDADAAYRRLTSWLARPATYAFTLVPAAAPPAETIVEAGAATPNDLRAALLAPPVAAIAAPYPLERILDDAGLRAALPRVDLDTLTFDFNQAAIPDDQLPRLDAIGAALAGLLADHPEEVFLLEGHTDAVGGDLYNLALSRQRAAAVATALVERYGILPDRLVVAGYGARFPRVDTLLPERENRRVTIRRITPLLAAAPVSDP